MKERILSWKIELGTGRVKRGKKTFETLSILSREREVKNFSCSDIAQQVRKIKLSDKSLRGFAIEMIRGKQFLDQILCHL
jgi:hypothetical protein